MGRKKLPKLNDKEQSARFIEKAKEIKSEGAKEVFEKALTKIIKKRKSSNKL